jgi:hypothetical protein
MLRSGQVGVQGGQISLLLRGTHSLQAAPGYDPGCFENFTLATDCHATSRVTNVADDSAAGSPSPLSQANDEGSQMWRCECGKPCHRRLGVPTMLGRRTLLTCALKHARMALLEADAEGITDRAKSLGSSPQKSSNPMDPAMSHLPNPLRHRSLKGCGLTWWADEMAVDVTSTVPAANFS